MTNGQIWAMFGLLYFTGMFVSTFVAGEFGIKKGWSGSRLIFTVVVWPVPLVIALLKGLWETLRDKKE